MGAAKTLRAVADNPWLRLVSATVLLASGGYEAVQTLEEMSFGAHHGVTLYGAITMLRCLPEILEGAELAHEAAEG